MTTEEPVTTPGSCASCGAAIIWAVTTKGKAMPVDALPVAGGTIRVASRRYPLPPLATVVGAAINLFDDDDTGDRHTSHFATCPDADEWRKR